MTTPRLADDWEQLVHALDGLVGSSLGSPPREPEPQVLLDRQLGEDPSPLGNQRDPGPDDLLGSPPGKRQAGEADISRTWTDGSHDCVQHRRLACAVRPDQPDDLPPSDGQIDAPDRRNGAMAPFEAADIERIGSGVAIGRALVDRALAQVCSRHVEVPSDVLRCALGKRPTLI